MFSAAEKWRSTLNDLNAEYTLGVEQLVESIIVKTKQEFQAQQDELQAAHKIEEEELATQNLQLNEQLTSTVRMYNELLADLRKQLDDARHQNEESEKRHERELQQLSKQSQLDEEQLKTTLEEYKVIIKDLRQQLDLVKRKDSDRDNNHQRQRLVLIQANNQLKAEVDALKRQLQEHATMGDMHDNGPQSPEKQLFTL